MIFRYLSLSLALTLLVSSTATSAEVVLNESNAVGSSKWLDEDGLDASDKADTQLGRIEGNGSNWFELAVVGNGTAGDTVDMRGWTLSWTEEADLGEIVLSSDTFSSNVPAGTLLTFSEEEIITSQDGTEIVNGSDIGINFGAGDHWAHVYSADTAYIASTDTNVEDDLDESGDAIFGAFSVGNDDWQLSIVDESMTTIFGPIGEGAPDVDAGVGPREVFKLESDLATTVDPTLYNDGSSSTFGQPNVWTDDMDMLRTQDFRSFGVVPEPGADISMLLGIGLLNFLRSKTR